MAFAKIISWYFEFELDGDTHVGKAHGPADEDFVRGKIANMHPGMKLTVLRPLKSDEEIIKRSSELAEDPNHIQMNNEVLKADATAAILTGQH